MKPYITTSFLVMSVLSGGLMMSPVSAQTVATQPAQHGRAGFAFNKGAMQQGQADLLGITLADLQARIAAGKTYQQIVTDLGLTKEQLATRMQDQQKARIQKEVTDGKITQAQADKMLTRMAQPHPFAGVRPELKKLEGKNGKRPEFKKPTAEEQAARLAEAKARVAKLVADGKLTQAQADKMAAHPMQPFGGFRGQKPGMKAPAAK